MHIAKKRGYVLIPNIILLMIISTIGVCICKIAMNNYIKADLYELDEDIRTLGLDYEELILEGEKYINENKDILEKVNEMIESNKSIVKGEYFKYIYPFSKDKYKKIIISNEGVYIRHEKGYGAKYILLEAKSEKNDEATLNYITLIPGYYKTDYIIR